MLKTSIAFLVVLASSAASAATLTCTQPWGDSPKGNAVQVNLGIPGADTILGQLRIRGERAPRRLVCIRPTPGPNGPDRIRRIVNCTEGYGNPRGYAVEVRAGGLAGKTLASIYVTGSGGASRNVGTYQCMRR